MDDKRMVPMSHSEASLATSSAWPLTLQASPTLEPVSLAWLSGEPSLPDLLADPLVLAVLRRDGLSLQDLRRAIALARSRLESTKHHQGASDAA